MRTFRSAPKGRPEGLHYASFQTMQTHPAGEKHAQDHDESRPPTDDGWMGAAYVGVIVVEVLVLVGLWAVGTYFGSL